MEVQGQKIKLSEKSNMTSAQMTQEMKSMDNVIQTLRKELQDALSKQHEAMGHAVRLAKKNRHLEDELRDIDQLALAIDKECNAQVKENTQKVSATQEKLDASLHKIYHLEKKVTVLQEENNALRKNIEELQKNCSKIKKSCERKLEEKDTEILEMKSNERELKQRMEGVSETLQNQRQRIMELENNNKGKEYPEQERLGEGMLDRGRLCGERVDGGRLNEAKQRSQRIRIRMRSRNSLQDSDEELNDMGQNKSRGRSGNRTGFAREEAEETNNQRSYWEGIGEKENDLRNNHEEQQQAMLEDSSTRNGTRIEMNSRSSPPVMSYSIKKVMAEIEHERDLAKADVQRLQDEIISLRERLKIASEIQQEERNRYEQFLAQEEERVKKLETECRNLHKSQGVLCGRVKGQEESISKLKEYLAIATKDLQQVDYLNKQLQAKNEEIERSLREAQENEAKLQEELSICHQQMKEMEENQRKMRNGTARNGQNTEIRTVNGERGQRDATQQERQLSSSQRLNGKQKENISLAKDDSLEKLQNSKRNETLELKTSNKQLQTEVERLQNAVADLQKSLESESEEVRYYQEKAQRLSDELESIQRNENNGRQQSRVAFEKEAEPRPSSSVHTRVTVRAGQWQGSKANGRMNSNQRNVKVLANNKPQGSRNSGIPNENAVTKNGLGKKSCSLKVGNRVYDFEVEDNASDTKGQSTCRLNNRNGQVQDRDSGRLKRKTNGGRYRSASPKLHVQAGLPSGSEVSLEYDEQEEERYSNW